MIYRDDIVETTDRAASTKPHQPSLEVIPVVVVTVTADDGKQIGAAAWCVDQLQTMRPVSSV